MRCHHDIEKETATTKHLKKAIKHYQAVAKRAVTAGHVVDIFACALDQVRRVQMVGGRGRVRPSPSPSPSPQPSPQPSPSPSPSPSP